MLHSLLTILLQQHQGLSVVQLQLSVGRQMSYSVFETGVQGVHANDDCARTNAAMEVKCSGSLVWVECCRRSGSIVV